MPPPSSGGITLALIANILEGWDLRAFGWRTPVALHLTAEAMRRAFADRNHYLGDPDFVDFPRACSCRRTYGARQRGTSPGPGDPVRADVPGLGAEAREPAPGAATAGRATRRISPSWMARQRRGPDDDDQLPVRSGVTVPAPGFLLNDEMDDFAAKPGEPNIYGLVQGEANAVAPGKRMLSAMTPTVVAGPGGRVLLVTGARGGPRIISAAWQVLSNVVDYGMGVGDAVRAPSVHHQHLPDALYFEPEGMD